jgi:biotin carboxyl carrier protein
VLVSEGPRSVRIYIDGHEFEVETVRPIRGRERKSKATDFMEEGRWVLQSPLTGSVVEARVSVGDKVEPGAILMVVEAMKMQNELRSRVAGRVAAVHVSPGQLVEGGMRLIEIEAESEPEGEPLA